MIRAERIHPLNTRPVQGGKYVLYWMQASQRIAGNLALNEAIRRANDLKLPVRIFFHIEPRFPEANERHFRFMLQGIAACIGKAARSGIRFEIGTRSLEDDFHRYFPEAAIIYCDRGYLRIQREWRRWLAEASPVPVIEVEDNLIVPVAAASSKAEWSARTIRPKIMEKFGYYSADGADPMPRPEECEPSAGPIETGPLQTLDRLLDEIHRREPLSGVAFRGGEEEALRHLETFIAEHLPDYDTRRRDPSQQATSRLSPYLHFGQISPLQVVARLLPQAGPDHPGAAVFIEELVVRRELAHNYVWYTPDYDRYDGLPAWSRRSLEEHLSDKRPYRYSYRMLDDAQTHDECWNAAMHEMKRTGFMENTMRMYWGKKIIEWTPTPWEAYEVALSLNNRYLVDGRDANSCAGVGWCFGLHDRPWAPRPVFGTVRYMNRAGLYRKYDMEKYIAANR